MKKDIYCDENITHTFSGKGLVFLLAEYQQKKGLLFPTIPGPINMRDTDSNNSAPIGNENESAGRAHGLHSSPCSKE